MFYPGNYLNGNNIAFGHRNDQNPIRYSNSNDITLYGMNTIPTNYFHYNSNQSQNHLINNKYDDSFMYLEKYYSNKSKPNRSYLTKEQPQVKTKGSNKSCHQKDNCNHGSLRKKTLSSLNSDLASIKYLTDTQAQFYVNPASKNYRLVYNEFETYETTKEIRHHYKYRYDKNTTTVNTKSRISGQGPSRNKSLHSLNEFDEFDKPVPKGSRSKSKVINEIYIGHDSRQIYQNVDFIEIKPKSLRKNSKSQHKSTKSNSNLSSISSESSKNKSELRPELEEKHVEKLEPKHAPPPPAPPIDLDLFKPINNSFVFSRLNLMKRSITRERDLETTKSFDAVVSELKTKLNKIRTNDENIIKFETLLQKSPGLTLISDQLKSGTIVNQKKTNFLQTEHNEVSKPKTLILQSSSSDHSTKESVKNFSKKKPWLTSSGSNSEQTTSNSNLDMTQLSSSSIQSENRLNGSLLDNTTIKASVPVSSVNNLQEVSSSNKIVNSVANSFKLELLNDSEEEYSDDYTKYDRVKFSPTKNVNLSESSLSVKKAYLNSSSTLNSINTIYKTQPDKLGSISFKEEQSKY